jgi:hypothetical protein
MCALIALSPIPIWAIVATLVGGPGLALDTARGAWVALYFWSFLAVLALACAIPHRPVVDRQTLIRRAEADLLDLRPVPPAGPSRRS